jgi:hypothetical protein
MKPIRHTKTARLQPLRMYREELDALVALFHKTCTMVTISDKEHSYESLDDMKAHVAKIRELDLQGENPGVHLLLNHPEEVRGYPQPVVISELRTEEISDEADALFREIKDFLAEHELPRLRMLFLTPAIVSACGLVLLLTHPYKQSVGWTAGVAACVTLLVVCLMPQVMWRNELTLETKLNSQSFWAVNKDRILLLIIGTILGIGGTLVGQFLSHLITK